MVLGQADRPLLERQLDRLDLHPARGIKALLLAGPAERERPGIRRVGQQVMHRPIARPRPADTALPDGPARQLLAVGDELDTTCRAEPSCCHSVKTRLIA